MGRHALIAIVRTGLCLLVTVPCLAKAGDLCSVALSQDTLAFAQLFHQRYPDFHRSREVTLAQVPTRKYSPVRFGTDGTAPGEKIRSFLAALEHVHRRADLSPSVRATLYRQYHERYVIQAANVPQGYFELQRKMARERGEGELDLTAKLKHSLAASVHEEQKKSLDRWLDYFLSADANGYPFYVKYWAFSSLLKLGKFDPDNGTFARRSSTTVAPYPDLNREALAKVSDWLEKYLARKTRAPLADPPFILDPKISRDLSEVNFGNLYGAAQKRLLDAKRAQAGTDSTSLSVTGTWVKYSGIGSWERMVAALENQGTGWCSAGSTVAMSQLAEGDLHVFFTADAAGSFTVPRVAIRTVGSKIAEVRGVAADQNLDSAIAGSPVLADKLAEFGVEGESFKKRRTHMQHLTQIEALQKAGADLSVSDLRFLYEVDEKIEGFGFEVDPRIKTIIVGRNRHLEDYAKIYGISSASDVSHTQAGALSGPKKLHVGDLKVTAQDVADVLARGIPRWELPRRITRNLSIVDLTSAADVSLPETVDGNVELLTPTYPEGLELPPVIHGMVTFQKITAARGLNLADKSWNALTFPQLKSAAGIVFPQKLEGGLYFPTLPSADELKLPESVLGDLDLSGLKQAASLRLPKYVKGGIYLGYLSSVGDLILPTELQGPLVLSALISADGIHLPETLGDLYLGNATSAAGIEMPKTMKGAINLSSLPHARALVFPEIVAGNVMLGKLVSAENLVLPREIEGYLDLSSLESAAGIRFPDKVTGNIYLRKLPASDLALLPASIRARVIR